MDARTKPPTTPAEMKKNRLPLSIFHSNSRSLPTSRASEIHPTFVIGRPFSPAFALFQSYSSPYFAHYCYLSPSYSGNYVDRRSHGYLWQQLFRRVRNFFFNANASMPPASTLEASTLEKNTTRTTQALVSIKSTRLRAFL